MDENKHSLIIISREYIFAKWSVSFNLCMSALLVQCPSYENGSFFFLSPNDLNIENVIDLKTPHYHYWNSMYLMHWFDVVTEMTFSKTILFSLHNSVEKKLKKKNQSSEQVRMKTKSCHMVIHILFMCET